MPPRVSAKTTARVFDSVKKTTPRRCARSRSVPLPLSRSAPGPSSLTPLLFALQAAALAKKEADAKAK